MPVTRDICPPTFYEFFSGGGMVRLGLGNQWTCTFANDVDRTKAATYRANFASNGELLIGDVSDVTLRQLPLVADLAWASFPCQDLSQAGAGRGLNGHRSGTFWSFWGLMERLANKGRAPRLIVVENVCGMLSSRKGKDFQEVSEAFSALDYKFGAVVIDARHFVPQSRPRLFLIGVRKDIRLPRGLTRNKASEEWHPSPLRVAIDRLSSETKRGWLWWRLPAPPHPDRTLSEIIETDPHFAPRDTRTQTRQLMALVPPDHRTRLAEAISGERNLVATLYRRMRPTKNGASVQRAEIRLDGLAGCLRTPSGGSSRQTVLVHDSEGFHSRKMTPREAARLMGLPETYELPDDRYAAYHLIADGVVVPVVEFLNEHLFLPILRSNENGFLSNQGALGHHATRKVAKHSA